MYPSRYIPLKQRIDLYDFGRPVQITAPPRHDTVDLARLMSTGA
jgi:hypothetical protein